MTRMSTTEVENRRMSSLSPDHLINPDAAEEEDLITLVDRISRDVDQLSKDNKVRFDQIDVKHRAIERHLGTMEANLRVLQGHMHERSGRVSTRHLDQRFDKMDAKLDNLQKRRYNTHFLISTGKLTMMHKTVLGCGYERARNLVPASVSLVLTPLDPEPALGAVIDLDASQLYAWSHGDILRCITFYNEDFNIVAADSLGDRMAKMRVWLTVG